MFNIFNMYNIIASKKSTPLCSFGKLACQSTLHAINESLQIEIRIALNVCVQDLNFVGVVCLYIHIHMQDVCK